MVTAGSGSSIAQKILRPLRRSRATRDSCGSGTGGAAASFGSARLTPRTWRSRGPRAIAAELRIVTQNVDGLHAAAADTPAAMPIELHGSLFRIRCTVCGARRDRLRPIVDATSRETLPECQKCGALARPDIVWFGESLDRGVLGEAMALATAADVCLVVGTSALVHPAAGLADLTRRNGGQRDRGQRRGHAVDAHGGGGTARARGGDRPGASRGRFTGMTQLDLASLRRTYALSSLNEGDVDADPIHQFERWFADAVSADVLEPNAMTLATASRDGVPSARIVLLKGVDARGFVFFTDYRSRKSAELTENPLAALVFLWKEIERQVRITGSVSRVSEAESEAYFRSRPAGSRLGAWASHQSAAIANRAELEARLREVSLRFPDGDVPLPTHWGGFRRGARRDRVLAGTVRPPARSACTDGRTPGGNVVRLSP